MICNISEDIKSLAVDISTLVHLENNPRKGDVDSIASSYKEFGQVRPIVVRPNGDGTATIIAGNHQVIAAKKLGWTHIAAVSTEFDDARAVAFALADNRTAELGHTDDRQLFQVLDEIKDEYSEFLDLLGWDEFELAALDETVSYAEKMDTDIGTAYVAPELVIPVTKQQLTQSEKSMISASTDNDGETRLEAADSVNTKDAVSFGSSAVGLSQSAKAVVQYSLVFDDAEQQRRWYDFIRYLKNSPVYNGDTTSQRLIEFIEAHADF